MPRETYIADEDRSKVQVLLKDLEVFYESIIVVLQLSFIHFVVLRLTSTKPSSF